MAAIAAIALTLYGAYQKKRAGDKSARAEKEALAAANEALKYRSIYKAGQGFFPGLLAAPGKPSKGVANPWAYLAHPTQGATSGGMASGAEFAANAPGNVTYNPGQMASPSHGGVDTTQVPQMGDPTATQKTAPTPATTGTPDKGTGVNTTPIPTPKPIGLPNPIVTPTTGTDKPGKPATNPGTNATPVVSGTETAPNAGSLVTQSLLQLLQHPGQLGSQTYEREQEQANQGLNVVRSIGNITGVGVDPRSGLGQVTTEGGLLNFAKQRNEAARDYSIAQEELRRQDITQAVQMYTDFLNTIFGLQKARAGVAGAVPTHAGAGNAYLGQAASDLGGGIAAMIPKPKGKDDGGPPHPAPGDKNV